jgi:nucleoside-diphosphate kinase
MGATDPKEAKDGTIRKLFAVSKGENSTHGSDSPAAAEREIAMNFRLDEIVG